MRILLFSIHLFIIFSCQSNKKEILEDSTPSTNKPFSDSVSIDLLSLKNSGKLNKTVDFTIENDAVYHKKKVYEGLPINEVFKSVPSFDNLNPTNTKVVFECEDGYKPEMPLEKLLSAKAFLAVKDKESSGERLFEKIEKNGTETKIAPFYVVYQAISPTDISYKWPYNLVKIHLLPLHQDDSVLIPSNEKAMAGYMVFKNHCLTCHAINKVGGQMGPELNFPTNITEYWEINALKRYIENPAKFRNNAKMPTLGLTSTEIEFVITYLQTMKNQKI